MDSNLKNVSSSWAKLRRGDITALNSIYVLYVDVLYDYGIKWNKDSESVMDCIHDLFLDLYKYRKRLSKDVNVKNYLLKSLKRKINERFKDKIILLSPEEDYSASVYKNEEVSIEEKINSQRARNCTQFEFRFWPKCFNEQTERSYQHAF